MARTIRRAPTPKRSPRRLLAMLGAVSGVGVAAGLIAWHGEGASAKPEAAKPEAAKPDAAKPEAAKTEAANPQTDRGVGQVQSGQQAPVPVFATAAKTEAVPIILRGIGSVQAYNTVSVKSRVDGNITQVAYKEGQNVKAGQLLIQLDPRPFQAALDQAMGTEEKDQAT